MDTIEFKYHLQTKISLKMIKLLNLSFFTMTGAGWIFIKRVFITPLHHLILVTVLLFDWNLYATLS